MRSDRNQHPIAAMTTKAMEYISRVRSSSRCSRKDIWPPSSSSAGLFESALKRVAILRTNYKSYSQSRLRVGSGCAGVFIGEMVAASLVASCDSGMASKDAEVSGSAVVDCPG